MPSDLPEPSDDWPVRDIPIEVLSEIERAMPGADGAARRYSVWGLSAVLGIGLVLCVSLLSPARWGIPAQPSGMQPDVRAKEGAASYAEYRPANGLGNSAFLQMPAISASAAPALSRPAAGMVEDDASGAGDNLPVRSVTFAGAIRVPKTMDDPGVPEDGAASPSQPIKM